MNNLEDWMGQYQPEERLLEEAMQWDGVEPMGGDEKNRITKRTLEKAALIPREEIRHSKRKGRARIAVLAACIATFAVVGIGYATGALDGTFQSWFAPSTEEQLAQLESAGTAIGAEVTSNGTVVRVREAIGDGSTVNLLIDVIPPKGTVLDAENYTFYQARVALTEKQGVGLGYFFSELERRGGVYTTILSVSSDSKLDGNTMALELQDFCVYKDEDERKAMAAGTSVREEDYVDDAYRVILPGEWKLEFPLDYQDTAVNVYPGVTVRKGDTDGKVQEVRVSPLSVSMQVQTRDLGEVMDYIFRKESRGSSFQWGAEDVVITMKDGTVLSPLSSGVQSDGRTMKMEYQFSKMVDVHEIDSIKLCGEELWKK